jgi:hypothetical protein
MTGLFLALLLPGLNLDLAAAQPTPVTAAEKLYRGVSSTVAAQDFELFLSPAPGASTLRDAAIVRVIVKRHGKAAVDGLLLTLSATSLAPKSVSRRQVKLSFEAGEKESASDFTVQNPGCGPAKVVASLFKELEPLARAEKLLKFGCDEASR